MPVYDSKTGKKSPEVQVEEDDELIYEGPDLDDIDLDEAIDTGALPVGDGLEDYTDDYEEDVPEQKQEPEVWQDKTSVQPVKSEPVPLWDTNQEETIFAGLSPTNWVYMLFILRIPVVSIFYILIHLASKKTTPVRRSFLKGYLYYKLIMLAVCIVILLIGVQIAAHYVEIALEYMKML